ncbi:hypothetical protein N0V86_007558 [Didymella sp. IMI 355093]|nr:hypothetical protein N0V86_007558 [Didymella sp. IMI 355093]
MSAVQPPATLSPSGPDEHAEPMNFLIQVFFLAHHPLGSPAEDFSNWGHDLCQSSLAMILSHLKMESEEHDFESPPVYEYSNVPLMPYNGDLDILDEREEEMQAFLVSGIGQLMALRDKPEAFEIVRQALVACDHLAVRTQVQVDWTSPFELLEQLPVDGLLLPYSELVLRCDSPEYACWSELVLRAGNTRHVAKVLRSMIGSCCFTGDCVDFGISREVCEE